jgi:hypothetical protein
VTINATYRDGRPDAERCGVPVRRPRRHRSPTGAWLAQLSRYYAWTSTTPISGSGSDRVPATVRAVAFVGMGLAILRLPERGPRQQQTA